MKTKRNYGEHADFAESRMVYLSHNLLIKKHVCLLSFATYLAFLMTFI